MPRLLVTGASGFVGRALLARLPAGAQALPMGVPDWERRLADAALDGATVYHLAARVHSRGASATDFQRDNVDKTAVLARAAAGGGARRLVYLSSAKVHGDESIAPFREDDPPAPQDAYARSKHRAEVALAGIAAETGLSTCVVRSPLVYGAGAGANLAALVRLADSPWPLPFATLANRRSFVHVDDLARLLVACGEQAAAHGRTYLAAHTESASTARLMTLLRDALGRPRRLYALPVDLLELAMTLLGQRERILRLTRSLEVDATRAMRELRWSAEIGLEPAVEELARARRAAPTP